MLIAPAPKAPYLSATLGAVFVVVCGWILSLAVRLIRGHPRGGLLTPFALRVSAVAFALLPVAGLFTGYYQDHGMVAVGQALAYLVVSVTLWSLARRRACAA